LDSFGLYCVFLCVYMYTYVFECERVYVYLYISTRVLGTWVSPVGFFWFVLCVFVCVHLYIRVCV